MTEMKEYMSARNNQTWVTLLVVKFCTVLETNRANVIQTENCIYHWIWQFHLRASESSNRKWQRQTKHQSWLTFRSFIILLDGQGNLKAYVTPHQHRNGHFEAWIPSRKGNEKYWFIKYKMHACALIKERLCQVLCISSQYCTGQY